MKKKTTVGIALLFIALSAFFVINSFVKHNDRDSNKSHKGKANQKVDAIIVNPALLINEITVTGTLVAKDEVILQNEVGGRIVQLNLPEGKKVKKGTLLVKLFDDDLQANLKKLNTQLALQQQIAGRQAELLQVNGISRNDYDQTVLQVNTLKADIEIEKTKIRKTEVLAPFDGVVGLRNVSVGAIITPSTQIAVFRTADKLKLDFFVPEKYSAEIKQGMSVRFKLYNADKIYNASVFATEEGIDAGTRNLKVRASVTDRSPELVSGAFANVTLHLSENQQALMIPTQAIIPQGDDKFVIVAQQGRAHMTNIKTGIRKNSKIEITEGLNAGDTIITTGLLFLNEGAPLFYSSVTK